MTDILTPEQRSRVMARVKNKNTKPETLVRKLLHAMGYRFRLHRKDLPGKPDIVLPRHRKVIFVHGCFWHGHEGCPRAARPTSNVEFWNAKIDGNKKRDSENRIALESSGWSVAVVWECRTRNLAELRETLGELLKTDGRP